MLGPTAHIDTFARDNLPPAETCKAIARIQSCLLQGITDKLPLYGEDAKTAWQHCR